MDRGMAIFLAIVVAAVLQCTAAQITHVVGGSLGWTVPPAGAIAYSSWASNASNNDFMVGDTLVFNFTTGNHDVAKVTKGVFDSCNGTSTISLISTGPVNITLNSEGEHYFICTFGQHCNLGQKLAINVTASSPVSAPSPSSSRTPGAHTTHVVGDSMGWTIPPGGAIDYSSWASNASNHDFMVGDTLVFNFTTGSHDVAKVTKGAFDNCDGTSNIALISTGPANITLDSEGEHYFICTVSQHCALGQKLAINVTASSGPTASLPSPPAGVHTTHVVGDSLGWTVPPDGSIAYSSWASDASNNDFMVGDTLVFNFTTGNHDVAKVTKGAFDSCNGTSIISLISTGPANITLDSEGEHYFICTFGQHCASGQKLAINVTTSSGPTAPPAVTSTTIFMAIIILCWRFRSSLFKLVIFWKKSKSAQNVEIFLKDYGSLVPKRYKYWDIKKMTNSFKNKLGQGGYGGVFKGKLLDGRLVAVKLLSESKGNGEEFINEVASISRTSHVNIVSLLGFCVEGAKRALIYEFMPNGSLEKFIYDENPVKPHSHLGWDRLYQIAVGIARGLEYLHRGCNTRILHFDIKPHNILLDKDFCPKISDFGLAKLCTREESIISMLGARGTAGYIAPEVFSRNFGGVSYKSDVYSYGMMVLEMVGGRKNIDAGVDNISEIYFPHWIYKNLHLSGHLGLSEISTEVDEEIARRMSLVGLWCIQPNPSDRPSMSKVLEMLEGSLISLKIPPKPFLSSPSRPPEHSSSP